MICHAAGNFPARSCFSCLTLSWVLGETADSQGTLIRKCTNNWKSLDETLVSLRSKHFRRAFRRFEAFFASRKCENWGEHKKVGGGGGEGRKGNACPQTPRIEKPVRPRTELP